MYIPSFTAAVVFTGVLMIGFVLGRWLGRDREKHISGAYDAMLRHYADLEDRYNCSLARYEELRKEKKNE